jgi:hypothetical protein
VARRPRRCCCCRSLRLGVALGTGWIGRKESDGICWGD